MTHRQGSHTVSRVIRLMAGFSAALVITMTTGPLVGAASAPAAGDTITGPANLANSLGAIESRPMFQHADWGIQIRDMSDDSVVAAQNDQKMFDPGSTLKTYSVATALRLYGPDYRFKTPVYREGTVTDGTLTGNLVLVASGDMSMGLRELPNGTLYYENAPQLDQSYADVGLPGAVEPPGNPLAALNQLAGMVRAAGITKVNGNVVIDDRLFTPFNGFPDGLVSPIWVNENLVDVLVQPTSVGQPASFTWRPMTASYSVTSSVTTVAANGTTSVQISEPSPGKLVVAGQIAVGTAPTLVVRQVDHPSAFARTLFIEALQNAGVTVTAPALGQNPESPPTQGELPGCRHARRARLGHTRPVREPDPEGQL